MASDYLFTRNILTIILVTVQLVVVIFGSTKSCLATFGMGGIVGIPAQIVRRCQWRRLRLGGVWVELIEGALGLWKIVQ